MPTGVATGVAPIWVPYGGSRAAARDTTLAVLVDDFLSGAAGATSDNGATNWTGPGASQNPSAVPSEAGHPGITRVPTGALVNSMTYLITGGIAAGGHCVVGTELWDSLFVWRQTTPDATNGIRVGVGTSPNTGTPTGGAYVEKLPADTSYFPVTREASAQTRGSALAACDNAWHKVRVRRIDAGSVGITFDALAEVVHTTNLPTSAVMLFVQITNSAANGSARTLDLDYADLWVSGVARA